jgi:hypothetical protein
MVFGSIGVFLYLGHLANSVFKDMIAFSFVLTILGLMIIFLAALYNRNQETIDKRIINMIPDWMQKHLPRNQIK